MLFFLISFLLNSIKDCKVRLQRKGEGVGDVSKYMARRVGVSAKLASSDRLLVFCCLPPQCGVDTTGLVEENPC